MYAEGAIRVLLVGSNDAAVRDLATTLHAVTGIEVVGKAYDSNDGVAAVGDLSPDAVLILADGPVREADAFDTIRSLAEARPQARVVFITGNAVRYLVPAMKAGAAGIVSPEAVLGELLPAICRIDR